MNKMEKRKGGDEYFPSINPVYPSSILFILSSFKEES